MRKILAAAAMSLIAMAYVAAPEAVAGAAQGTANLFVAVGRAALSIVTLGTAGGSTTPTGGGGQIVQLDDGTQVWVPDGATVEPAQE